MHKKVLFVVWEVLAVVFLDFLRFDLQKPWFLGTKNLVFDGLGCPR